MSFWRELRRRNVVRVGVAYLVAAWLLIQIVDNVAVPLALPGWTPTLVIVLLGVGFVVALVMAWAFELTPQGLRRAASVPADTPLAGIFSRKWDFVVIRDHGLVDYWRAYGWPDLCRPLDGDDFECE
jgi:hypothetical protein